MAGPLWSRLGPESSARALPSPNWNSRLTWTDRRLCSREWHPGSSGITGIPSRLVHTWWNLWPARTRTLQPSLKPLWRKSLSLFSLFLLALITLWLCSLVIFGIPVALGWPKQNSTELSPTVAAHAAPSFVVAFACFVFYSVDHGYHTSVHLHFFFLLMKLHELSSYFSSKSSRCTKPMTFKDELKVAHYIDWLFSRICISPWLVGSTQYRLGGSWSAGIKGVVMTQSRVWVLTWSEQIGKNHKSLHVKAWNSFVLLLAAMPSFHFEDARCRLSSCSEITALLLGYAAVAWKTVWSQSQNLYRCVSQIITPQVTLDRILLENVREKKRENLIIAVLSTWTAQYGWSFLVFFSFFFLIKSHRLVTVASRP